MVAVRSAFRLLRPPLCPASLLLIGGREGKGGTSRVKTAKELSFRALFGVVLLVVCAISALVSFHLSEVVDAQYQLLHERAISLSPSSKRMSASSSFNPPRLDVPSFSFDSVTGKWTNSAAAFNANFVAKDPLDRRLSVATWNVWFDRFAWRERLGAMIQSFKTLSPDFICLQEMTPRVATDLLASEFVRNHYAVSGDPSDLLSDNSKVLGRYGVLILSRLPVQSFSLHKMRSAQGRGLLVAQSSWQGHQLAISTIHLESEDPNTERRKEQLTKSQEILNEIVASPSIKFIMGDFNFHDTWPEQDVIQPQYIDIWSHLRPDEPGFTEDTSINTMRLEITKHDKFVRFDRILLESPPSSSPGRLVLEPQSIQLLGTLPVDGALYDRVTHVFPSDHFGLFASFDLARDV